MPIFTDGEAAHGFQQLAENVTLITYVLPAQLAILLNDVHASGVQHVVMNPEPKGITSKLSALAPSGYIYPITEYRETLLKMQAELN